MMMLCDTTTAAEKPVKLSVAAISFAHSADNIKRSRPPAPQI